MNETIGDEYVTATIGGQLFGLPILRVQDVFAAESMTRIPLASGEIAGLLNLRGRIVTIVDLKRRLGVTASTASDDDGAVQSTAAEFSNQKRAHRRRMALSVEHKGESYGLLIDEVGEVMRLAAENRESNPINMEQKFASVSQGVYRLEGRILVILDVDRLLDFEVRERSLSAAA